MFSLAQYQLTLSHRSTLVALVGILVTSVEAGPKTSDLAGELPRVQPLSPAEALKTFVVHPEFRLELVAAEPDVLDPVSLAFDENGRMYVAEMPGYPYAPTPDKKKTGRVRMLEDTDNDGKVDRSRVFADGLASCVTAVLPWRGGVFVAAAPDLLYLKDHTGDGVADERRVLFTGFGVAKAQGLLNNFCWGLDNWIYVASNANVSQLREPNTPEELAITLRNQDFRFRPESGEFELLSAGGQFGHSMDDWGERFVCSNSKHLRHVVLSGLYLQRNPYLSVADVTIDIAEDGPSAAVYRRSPPEPWRIVRSRRRASGQPPYTLVDNPDPSGTARYRPTELVATGFFTSGTGVTIYRGSAYPQSFRGNAFVGGPAGNLVHRKVLDPDGVTFTARRARKQIEFITSSDNFFRPVNFANGPDGCLYVLDFYREVIEGHEFIYDDVKKHLDFTSGRDRGRIYRIVPHNFQRPKSPRLGSASADKLIACLAHPDAWWRETAQRLLVERGVARGQVGARLRKLARSAQRGVTRVHAMWTLEGLSELDEVTILTNLYHSNPRIREHAVRLAETRIIKSSDIAHAVIELARDPTPRVRFQTAYSLGVLPGAAPLQALAEIIRRDTHDRFVRAAVLTAVSTRAGALFERLAQDIDFLNDPSSAETFVELAAVVGGRGEENEVASILLALGGEKREESQRWRRDVVRGLSRGLATAGKTIAEVITNAHDAKLAQRILDKVFQKALTIARDDGASLDRRIEAIELAGQADVEIAKALAALLTFREPDAIQLAVVRALSRQSATSVAKSLLEKWGTLSPLVRREIIEALFARTERIAFLLQAIEDGAVTATDLEPARRQALRRHENPSIRERALDILSGAGNADRRGVLESYMASLARNGDIGRGEKIFTKLCSGCHQAGGKGSSLGPNLASSQGHTAESLLTQILDPNREVLPTYLNYTLITHTGRVTTGMIAAETATSVTLRRAKDAEDTVLRTNIATLTSSGLSLMPEGFEKEIDLQSMADLITFVKTIGTR